MHLQHCTYLQVASRRFASAPLKPSLLLLAFTLLACCFQRGYYLVKHSHVLSGSAKQVLPLEAPLGDSKPPKGHDLDQGRDKGDLRQEIMDPVMGYYLQKVDRFIESPDFQAWTLQQTHKQEIGILTTCGGSRLITNLVVMLKVLREHVKCTLPVEVAYRGTEDMQNDTLLQLIALFNPLDGLDLLRLPRLPHEMRLPSMGGWVAKTRALLYSRFQKVLMLDVDVVPLIDPATLFAAPEFLAHGNIFWPDSWDSWVSDSAFHLLGLKRTETQGILNKGKGKLPHDTESGIVMFDRVRHSDVLHYLWFINTFAPKVYQHLHGDKDTFALSFALCGRKVNQFFQLDTPPGGAFHWGQGVLENKTVGEGEDGRYTDGWQLVGFVQHSPIQPAAPVFLHRTMNKWNINEEPWPVSVISGPMPPSWTKFYLAHDSIGQTKGRWWEHVAPGFALHIAGPPHSQQGNFQPARSGAKLEGDALESPNGSNPSQEHILGDQTRVKACQIETLYKLLSPINVSLIKQDDDKPDPLPAIHASLPNYPASLVPAVQKSGCESSFISIRAAYRAHKWLQDGARSMFLQMDH